MPTSSPATWRTPPPPARPSVTATSPRPSSPSNRWPPATEARLSERRPTTRALKAMREAGSADGVTVGGGVAPPYFGFAARPIRSDHDPLDNLGAPPVLSVEETGWWLADGGVLIDGGP